MQILMSARICPDQFTYNGNKAGVDVVLIQRFLLSYANYVFLMLTGIFQHNFHKKEKNVRLGFMHFHSQVRLLSPQL